MNFRHTVVALGLAACTTGSAIAASADVLATVNGTHITQQTLEVYARQRGIDDLSKLAPDRKTKIIDELVNRELLYRAALDKKLDKKPDTTAELESARANILASSAVRNELDARGELSEAKLKEGYDKFIKDLPGLEYKTRHILLDSEEKAKEVIAALDKGGDFAKLANEHSTGAADGGELEWFQPEDMIKPFSDAAVKLQKDQYTKTPVQTQYGWHVIQLQDTRKVTPPTFEDVKEQIRTSARNAAIEAYIKGLREKAKVEIK
ncbi:MAG: peptidylprolyl isomerase [Gammaproteobacteria bacterium]|nr:peptidylprolyl isomerase [Gammaproteobacteria bacterium]